ncbi:MAG TPA: hypothetical protein VD999_01165 [Vitreimonas sp.]|nr:hypothetical protein [Vitreimonas sp.]
MSTTFRSILIIDPHETMSVPYQYLQAYAITRVPTIEQAIAKLQDPLLPELIFLSASYSPTKSLTFLEALKNSLTTELVPIIITVNFETKLSTVIGTMWGKRIGICHSLSSPAELYSTIERIMQ